MTTSSQLGVKEGQKATKYSDVAQRLGLPFQSCVLHDTGAAGPSTTRFLDQLTRDLDNSEPTHHSPRALLAARVNPRGHFCMLVLLPLLGCIKGFGPCSLGHAPPPHNIQPRTPACSPHGDEFSVLLLGLTGGRPKSLEVDGSDTAPLEDRWRAARRAVRHGLLQYHELATAVVLALDTVTKGGLEPRRLGFELSVGALLVLLCESDHAHCVLRSGVFPLV